jgi:hypothetical protein
VPDVSLHRIMQMRSSPLELVLPSRYSGFISRSLSGAAPGMTAWAKSQSEICNSQAIMAKSAGTGAKQSEKPVRHWSADATTERCKM